MFVCLSVFAPKTYFGRDRHNFSETDSRGRVPIAIAYFVRFHCPFPFLFLDPFTLSLPFAYHICSGCPKKLGGNETLINYSYNGPFCQHYCAKTDDVIFQFATSECRRYPKPTVVRIDLS